MDITSYMLKYVGMCVNKVQCTCMYFTCINIPKLNLCSSSSMKVIKLTCTLEFIALLLCYHAKFHKVQSLKNNNKQINYTVISLTFYEASSIINGIVRK
jgi:hypothetical protein